MKGIILVSLVFSIFSSQILNHLEKEFQHINKLYESGNTSLAFSQSMKLYFIIKNHQSILDQKIKPELNINLNCNQTLEKLSQRVIEHDWIKNFQSIFSLLVNLQSGCTNMDFGGSNIFTDEFQGFDNKCALCVIITRVIENYIQYHDKDVTDFIQNQLCELFDGTLKPTCQAFIHYAGPYIIQGLINKESADVICLSAEYCTDPTCKITKPSSWTDEEFQYNRYNQYSPPTPWDWIYHIIVDKFGNGHLPPFDLDNDTFSDIQTFRGYNWRGHDCNQLDRAVYPGRKTGSDLIDHDCNGIYGLNPKTGKSYQKQFCMESKRLGLMVIGDSAGAHFSLPQKYLNASMIQKGTYDDLLHRVQNELDLPHESGYTANVNTSGYIRHSVYKYLRSWNLCNNNDYQNAAVNGGDSKNTWQNIKAVSRKQQHDHPVLMFMELIGNDVCKKSFESMTKEIQFKENILRLLNYLDEKVPSGSHLIILGLADGDVLYDNLHNATHPLNITFETFYNFLNCLKISPCWGWLNNNQTVREFTTERAKNLSKVYKEIIADGTTFKNFDFAYYDFPTQEILNRKIMQGGDPKDMFERCDGFHPNGEFHSDLGDWLWKKIIQDHPNWIGKKNPYNDQIRKMFNIEVLE